MILHRNLLPLNYKHCNRVRGAKTFTQLYLQAGYNLIKIKKGDEWKTAFYLRYGSSYYRYMVKPFGMDNAPATLQNIKNEVLKDMIDCGVVRQLNNILVTADILLYTS